MFKVCPKCCYTRRDTDTAPPEVCPQCGIVFAKWLKQQAELQNMAPADKNPSASVSSFLRSLFFDVKPFSKEVFYGALVLYIGFVIWGFYFIRLDVYSTDLGNSFMHRINLLFHEAGHWVFMPLGRFMGILGGSLGQILMPFIVTVALLWKNRDPFGASFGLWWMGQSMIDLGPYISDARSMALPLLGGGNGRDRPGAHDWNNILTDLGYLQSDFLIASAVFNIGSFLIILSFIWGGYLLYKLKNQIKS